MFSKIPNWAWILALVIVVGGATLFIARKRKKRLKDGKSAAAEAAANLAKMASGDISKVATPAAGVNSLPAVAMPNGSVIVETAAGHTEVGKVDIAPTMPIPVQLTDTGHVIGNATMPNGTLNAAILGGHTLPSVVISGANSAVLSTKPNAAINNGSQMNPTPVMPLPVPLQTQLLQNAYSGSGGVAGPGGKGPQNLNALGISNQNL